MCAGVGSSVKKGRRMSVRIEWAQTLRQAGWHRRNIYPVPACKRAWDRFFVCPKNRKGECIMEKKIPYKIYLEESEMPKAWYNLRADMVNKPAPLLNPDTHEPMTAEDLSGVFCDELIR